MNEITGDVKECYALDYQDRFLIEDVDNRFLMLNDEVNSTVFDTIVYQILRYNRLDKGIPVGERKPIRLYINSPGGAVSDGFGLMDAIMQSITPVHTINLGECASMALLIFMAGHERYSFKHGEFLLHDGTTVNAGNTSRVKDMMVFQTEQMDEMTKAFVLERSLITEQQYKDHYRCEWYFFAEEAKKLGVVDYIIGEDCTVYDIL